MSSYYLVIIVCIIVILLTFIFIWKNKSLFFLNSLLKKAKNGSPKAQMLLGFMYYTGKGVKKNLSEGLTWFNKAAENGDVEAQFILAGIYFEGNIVDKNFQKGIDWIKKSAEGGYAPAQLALGNMYAEGRFVEKSTAASIKWFILAAEGKNLQAQKIVAGIYHLSPGYDKKVAYAWYSVAAFMGDNYSKDVAETLFQTFSDEDKVSASELSSLYISKYTNKSKLD